jgi:hypothetical protein
MLPKEHGAYGQLAFPLVTAIAAAGATGPTLLIVVAAIALFVAHEPLLVLLNQRGPRALREDGPRARRWLAASLLIAVAAGAVAILLAPPSARWAFFVPVLPGAWLLDRAVRGREKTTAGETGAAVAFASIAVPIVVAGGESWHLGAAIALAFALLFAASTLAVRVVILRTRAGGDPVAARRTRVGVFSLAALGAVIAVAATAAGVVGRGAALAVLPGLLFACIVAAFPPRPTKLRRVGWTLVAVSALTSILLVVAA